MIVHLNQINSFIFIFSSYFFEKIQFKNYNIIKNFFILYLLVISCWSLFFLKDVLKSESYKILFTRNIDKQRNIILKNDSRLKNSYDYINKNKISELFIICSEATDNFYFDIKKPKVTLNGWLYTKPGYKHKYFIDHYNELISKNSGFVFFINKICMTKSRPTTRFFDYLIANSNEIKHDGYFHIRSLK